MRTVKAWVNQINGRWVIIWEGTIHPGHQNRTIKTFDARWKAVKCAKEKCYQSHIKVEVDLAICPLPIASEEMRMSYING